MCGPPITTWQAGLADLAAAATLMTSTSLCVAAVMPTTSGELRAMTRTSSSSDGLLAAESMSSHGMLRSPSTARRYRQSKRRQRSPLLTHGWGTSLLTIFVSGGLTSSTLTESPCRGGGLRLTGDDSMHVDESVYAQGLQIVRQRIVPEKLRVAANIQRHRHIGMRQPEAVAQALVAAPRDFPRVSAWSLQRAVRHCLVVVT